MSKQSEAKAAQNWKRKPDTCASCAHFMCDVIEKHYEAFNGPQTWTEERNLRCGLGGFKTGKSSTCDRFEARPLEPQPIE